MRKIALLLLPLALYTIASTPTGKALSPATADWGSCSVDCSPCLTDQDCRPFGLGNCLTECP